MLARWCDAIMQGESILKMTIIKDESHVPVLAKHVVSQEGDPNSWQDHATLHLREGES